MRSNACSRVSLIKRLFEGGHADAPVGGEEVLVLAAAQIEIGIDDGLDRIDDFFGREIPAR